MVGNITDHVLVWELLKMKTTKFVFDCDGVLQDYVGTLDQLMWETYKELPIDKYSILERYPSLSTKQINVVWDKMGKHIEYLSEIDNAFSVLKALQNNKHLVYVATAIPDSLYDQRMKSFAAYGFIPTALYCVGNTPKTSVYKNTEADYMFDDQLFHLSEADGIVENKILINNNIPQKYNSLVKSYRKYISVKHWYATEQSFL